MKFAPFEYVRPETVQEALSLCSRHGEDGRILAGGQSLLPTMAYRLAQPEVLIDINRVEELAHILAPDEGGITIGALARHTDVERSPNVKSRQPLVTEAISHVAHSQIRNRGTLCGNLAHADPASEMPAVMLALDAVFHVWSESGKRRVPAHEFFWGTFETDLKEGEMLVAVEIPDLPRNSGTCFMEFARRPGDYALSGLAAVLRTDDAGICRDARLAFCNAADRPVVAVAAQTALVGERITDELITEVSEIVSKELSPPGDAAVSSEYKKHLAKVLTKRAIPVAAQRAA